jgi:hypothetical protein
LESVTEWFDTELMEPCYATELSTGSILCLPNMRYPGTGSYYADADCSEPLLVEFTDPCTENPAPFRTLEFDDAAECGSTVLSVRALEAYEGTVYTDPGDGCAEVEPQATELVLELGAEIPLSTFAEITETDR